MNKLAIIYFMCLAIFVNISCSQNSKKREEDCGYKCRSEYFEIEIVPNEIPLGKTASLEIRRRKKILPKMRVFLGNYDENYKLPYDSPLRYFQGTDFLARTTLLPESSGKKSIKGIIEEYKEITKDSVLSYQYRFEVELIVLDTLTKI